MEHPTFPQSIFAPLPAEPRYEPAPGYEPVPRYESAPGYEPAPRYEQRGPRYEAPEEERNVQLPPHLRRQIVNYPTRDAPGTIIIDTPNTYLYLVLGNGKAMRYGIGVGREGFTWSGVQKVARKQEWPDWHPPAEMIARQPYLPRFMSGGPGNPLGARAMYLGNSLYRIHGTNEPATIGKRVSSGCIRLTNEDVEDLYNRVNIGAKVVVLNDPRHRVPAEVASMPAPQPAQPRERYESRYETRYEQRYEDPLLYAPRPQVDMPAGGANRYYGGQVPRSY